MCTACAPFFPAARFKANLNFTEPERAGFFRFFGIVQRSCPATAAVQFIFCMTVKVPVQPLSAFTPDSTFLCAGYKVPSMPAFHENAVCPFFLPLNRTEHSGLKTVCLVQAECKRLSGAKLAPNSASSGAAFIFMSAFTDDFHAFCRPKAVFCAALSSYRIPADIPARTDCMGMFLKGRCSCGFTKSFMRSFSNEPFWFK